MLNAEKNAVDVRGLGPESPGGVGIAIARVHAGQHPDHGVGRAWTAS